MPKRHKKHQHIFSVAWCHSHHHWILNMTFSIIVIVTSLLAIVILMIPNASLKWSFSPFRTKKEHFCFKVYVLKVPPLMSLVLHFSVLPNRTNRRQLICSKKLYNKRHQNSKAWLFKFRTDIVIIGLTITLYYREM